MQDTNKALSCLIHASKSYGGKNGFLHLMKFMQWCFSLTFQWLSCFWRDAFFCVALGILLKRSVSNGYLISCPIWSKFSPRPECQKSNTAGFPVILRLEKAQCGDIAPASSYLHRKRQRCMALVFENKLWRREAAELLFQDFSGFR